MCFQAPKVNADNKSIVVVFSVATNYLDLDTFSSEKRHLKFKEEY